jgi:predicted ATPase/class 3 adenylate cyclase
MDTTLHVYLPEERRDALSRGVVLPERAIGAALFADIAGFTQLTEGLVGALGARRGVEALTGHLNQVYDALVAEVQRYGGSVVSFSGDAITCWFDDRFEFSTQHSAALRAATCAHAMQVAMRRFAAMSLPRSTVSLAVKVTVASGPARRFTVGSPTIQLIDVVAGTTIARMAEAEHLATQGDVLVDETTAAALGEHVQIAEWREGAGQRFALVTALRQPADPTPWPEPDSAALPPERLRPWVLPAIAERHNAGLGILLTELRPCVTCFVRFTGFDYDGDEGAGTQLDAFIRAAQAALARYGGVLLQITTGDKGSYFYAVFGAPAAHEDDAARAVHAALDLQRAVLDLGVAPLQIGISQGTLRVGDYGARNRRAYGVLGDEVNLAARLMVLAQPGETLVSGRVQHAAAETFAFEPRPPIPVKGKAEPLPVFAIAGPRRRRAIRLEEPDYRLPMVGRGAPLQQAGALLNQVLSGQGQVLAVTAEAGMGKSRLVAEIVRLARQLGFAGYGGSCQAAGVRSPYLVWESIWRAFFDVDPEATVRRQVRQLERAVEDMAPDRLDALPLLGPLLGVPLPNNEVTAALEPRFRRSALHALLLDCLSFAAREAQAEGSGLLLVLDDMHWIDPASEELLAEIAEHIVDLPVLLVLAYRPPELLGQSRPRIETLPHATTLTLNPLAAPEAEQMIRAKLAQLFPERAVGAPPALVARVTTLAQGNPFYVEELLSYLRDRGIDPRDALAIAALDLPTSLHTLVLSRLDQLSSRQQATLKTASVVGRRFLVAWLHGAFPQIRQADSLKDDLSELARLELTPLDTPEPELAYLFKHIVTREVAYESVSADTRAILHEQLAAFLEHAAGGDETRYVDLLAYHYELSDNLAKKRLYLHRAAVAAAARFASGEALAYLSRALALAPADDHAERFALLSTRERLLDLLSDRTTQRADLEELERHALALGDDRLRALVLARRADMLHRTGHSAAACEDAAQAIELGLAAGAVSTAVEAYQFWTWSLLQLGEYNAAQEKAERALELARTTGVLADECAAHNSLGGVAEYRGDYSRAREHYTRVLECTRARGDKRGESAVLNNLGNIARQSADLAGARQCLEQSVAGFRIVGDRQGEGIARNDLGQVAADEMNIAEAYRQYEQARALARAVGDNEGESWTLCALGNAAKLWGDYSTARAYYDQALAMFRMIGMYGAEAWLLTPIGECAFSLGEHEYALEVAEASLAKARELDDRGLESRAALLAGTALAEQGRLAEAEARYQQSVTVRAALGWDHLLLEPWAGLARVRLTLGDLAGALQYVELILAYLHAGRPLDPIIRAVRVDLTVFDVLSAANDPRASTELGAAHARLLARVATLEDEQLRQSYLEGTPHRRRLRDLYAALSRPKLAVPLSTAAELPAVQKT